MLESKFLGKEFASRPRCPFCGIIIDRPKELSTRRQGEMPVGICSCGATYACDETGHNQGSAMIEALVFGCDMDWDLAWELLPEEDYIQEIVETYDYKNHLIVHGGFFEGRRIAGILFFIKLHEEVREVTADGVLKRIKAAVPKPVPDDNKPCDTGKKALSKKEIEKLVKKYDVDSLLHAAGNDKKLLRNLQRLLYSGDNLFRHRAADILGQVSAVIGRQDPGSISKLLQGFFYAISDTAASSWGAFEAIGEIISRKPDQFAGYIPQLFQYMADHDRRAMALQAIGRIAGARPDLLRKYNLRFMPFLDGPDPLVRGYAAWLMGNLRVDESRKKLEGLIGEAYEIEIYENGDLNKTTVGQVASNALKTLTP